MNRCSIYLTIAIMAFSVAFAAVLKFDPFSASERFETEMKGLMEFLMKPRVPSRYVPADVYEKMGLNPKTRLMAYRWDNCGNKSAENFLIHDLEFAPDPISFPGTFSVAFSLSINVSVEHVMADVLLEKKVGSGWLKIPCFGNIGSCHYDDICPLLNNIPECPPQFLAANVPCKCPFNKGSYKLPKASFQVDASVLPPGDYHIQANLTGQNNLYGGCYNIYASFE